MKGCSSFAITVNFLGMIYDTVLNILVKQTGVDVECGYGDWLKATSGRA